MPSLVATAPKGVEPILRDEMRSLHFSDVRAGRGGVSFSGDVADAMRACLWLRTAMRVLVPVAEFDCEDATALYEGTAAVEWESHLAPENTIAVDAVGKTDALRNTVFTAQKVKDAIVDRLRSKRGSRPDVSPRDPDIRVVVRLDGRRASLALDASGESLHLRGYRTAGGDAPLRETLAAAMLLRAGWDGKLTLCDPMCGAGTIAIEAALLARNMAPGINRRFGFERWPTHGDAERAELLRLRQEARERALGRSPAPILASDDGATAIDAARENARTAGVEADIAFSVADVRDLAIERGAVIVTNPPYGQRLRSGVEVALYQDLARAFRGVRPRGMAVLSANPAWPDAFGLKPAWVHDLYNGPLRCKLYGYGRLIV